MEFKEFNNPLDENYDITSSLKENEFNNYSSVNQKNYSDDLIELIGILEDIDEEELFKKYGITIDEYFQPTEEVIEKVKSKLGIRQGR